MIDLIKTTMQYHTEKNNTPFHFSPHTKQDVNNLITATNKRQRSFVYSRLIAVFYTSTDNNIVLLLSY